MEKQDLREYSENELSLMVFNDEGLYCMRNSRGLVEFLKDYFEFTEEQLEVLIQDLIDDVKEET